MFKDFITYVKVRVIIVGACTIADRYIKAYMRVMEKKKEAEKKESYRNKNTVPEPAQVKASGSSRIKAERQIGFNTEW